MARTASLSSRSSRPRRSSRSSSSVRSRASAARSAKTSTRRSSCGPSGRWGAREEIASTPSVRPPAVRTGQEMNDELRYQSQARRAVSGSSSSSRRCAQRGRALPLLEAAEEQRLAALDRRLGDAGALAVVRALEHGRHRLARLVAGEPGRGRADQAAPRSRRPGTRSRSRRAGAGSVRRSPRACAAATSVPRPPPRPYLHALRLTTDRARRGGSGALSLAIRSSEAESPLEGQACGVSTPRAASMARGPARRRSVNQVRSGRKQP